MSELERLRKENAELKALVVKLLARIDELEARLKINSGNSSKSPSSDMGGRTRRPPSEPSKRKRGGQPNHDGKTRDLVAAEEVDEVIDIDPEVCIKCGNPLGDEERLEAYRRQVTETPEFKAFVQEYRLWRKRCSRCGYVSRGEMPEGAPTGAFGPRLQARIGLLSGRFRMTRRETKTLAKDFFGVQISLGSVQACCEAVSEAASETATAIHEEVKQSNRVHADETGFGKCGGKRMWLWVAATENAEVFKLQEGRGQEQAKALLGEDFSGIIQRDRWKPYEIFKKAQHQLCHSHIRRDFQSMLESMGETGTQGAMLKLASDRAFHLWHQFERGELDRNTLIQKMKPIESELRKRLIILRDAPKITQKAKGTATDLLRQWGSMWTYVHQEDSVPTNNEAERSIRKAVIWRKTSLGVESTKGAAFVERMLTLAGTARKRSVDLLEWLTQSIKAKLSGQSTPPFKLDC